MGKPLRDEARHRRLADPEGSVEENHHDALLGDEPFGPVVLTDLVLVDREPVGMFRESWLNEQALDGCFRTGTARVRANEFDVLGPIRERMNVLQYVYVTIFEN